MSGVPLSEATAADFINVRAALVKRLGGNANYAVVWQRLFFRTAQASPDAYDRGGERWWRADREALATETGLSVDQVRRALEVLEKDGYLEGIQHAFGGPYDRTKSYRCILANTDMANLPDEKANLPDEGANLPHRQANLPDVPLTQEVVITSAVADATLRPDVEEILDYLDAAIERNEAKRPQRNKRNKEAARLLIDRDGHSVEKIKKAIDWSTSHSFWRAHILSAYKLREKYDQMRLQASNTGPAAQPKQPAYAGREEYTPPE